MNDDHYQTLYAVSILGTAFLVVLLSIEEHRRRSAKPIVPTFALLQLIALGLAIIPHAIDIASTSQFLVYSPVLILVPYLSEAAALRWSGLFGKYHYGSKIGPLLPLGVPIGVVFAWMIVLYCTLFTAIILARLLQFSPVTAAWFTPVLAALFAVKYDMVIDPINVAEGNWSWEAEKRNPVWMNRFFGFRWFGIPTGNFFAWFLIAFATLGSASVLAGLPMIESDDVFHRDFFAMPLLWQAIVLLFRAEAAKRNKLPAIALVASLYALFVVVVFVWWRFQ